MSRRCCTISTALPEMFETILSPFCWLPRMSAMSTSVTCSSAAIAGGTAADFVYATGPLICCEPSAPVTGLISR